MGVGKSTDVCIARSLQIAPTLKVFRSSSFSEIGVHYRIPKPFGLRPASVLELGYFSCHKVASGIIVGKETAIASVAWNVERSHFIRALDPIAAKGCSFATHNSGTVKVGSYE